MSALYSPLSGATDMIYFGYDPRDFGSMQPLAWFHKNHDRFLFSAEEIAAARSPYNHEAVPNWEGVYFLFTEERLVYVGQSREIATRLQQHAHPWSLAALPVEWLTHFAALWVPLQLLDVVEGYYIHLLRPPRNKKYPPLRHFTRYLPRT